MDPGVGPLQQSSCQASEMHSARRSPPTVAWWRLLLGVGAEMAASVWGIAKAAARRLLEATTLVETL